MVIRSSCVALLAVPDPINGVALGQGATLLTRSGDVSTASGSACAEIVTSMCESACHTCITGSLCSWSWSVMNSTTNAGGNTFGSAADCAFALDATLCGDIDSPGSALGSCATAELSPIDVTSHGRIMFPTCSANGQPMLSSTSICQS
jgi:hypothetical protein